MKLTGNTILVTGGASGIGYALATRFHQLGNEVIICGRREDKLMDAKDAHPDLHTYVCDLADPRQREELCSWVQTYHSRMNVLVNNAGIQRSVDLTGDEHWDLTHAEIAINLEAPIHLSRLFYPRLVQQDSPAILNVTSGLSFVPLASVPVYCATKAAMHSYTLSLRSQLSESGIEVIEIVPPAVDTDLQAPGLHKFGVNVEEFTDAVVKGLEAGEKEIAYGTAEGASQASRKQLEAIFQQMNRTSG
jgi:uncharacterized oxidoreductase